MAMNIIKWLRDGKQKSRAERIKKGGKIRKNIKKDLPKLGKNKGIVGVIARKRLRDQKILEELDK